MEDGGRRLRKWVVGVSERSERSESSASGLVWRSNQNLEASKQPQLEIKILSHVTAKQKVYTERNFEELHIFI